MALISIIQCDRCGKQEQMPTPQGFDGGTVRWARLKIDWPRYMAPTDNCFAVTVKPVDIDVCADCARECRFFAEGAPAKALIR